MAVTWPAGFTSSGVRCGIKSDGSDLGLLVADAPVVWAGTFTQNAAAAAPVTWSRSQEDHPARALIVTSGNANACTGAAGQVAVMTETDATATALGCSPSEVLVAATGPIGVPLPTERVVAAIPAAAANLERDPDPFARAILTTDTVTKVASASAGGSSVLGVAKGAAMLAPNMATMLAFVTTDAEIPASDLKDISLHAVSRTFNRISVDACESTNDSVFFFASGRAGRVPPAVLEEALTKVCNQLAEAMVRDAEGGSRFVRIAVTGAGDEATAERLARAVASSALWKAAVHGKDPNWGRIVSALGSVDRSLDLGSLTVSLGGIPVFKSGEPVVGSDARAAMEAADIEVECDLGGGSAPTVEFLTSDLSPEYVLLNAEGST